MSGTIIGKVQARVVQVKRPNYTGPVVEHHHGDGKWHWAQDVHVFTQHRTAHADVAGIAKPVWVGPADAAGYAEALKPGGKRVPIRKQGQSSTPSLDVNAAVAEVIDLLAQERTVA